MRRRITCLLIVVLVQACAVWARSAENPPGAGTLTIGGRAYKLAHFAVYETKSSDAELVSVLASSNALPIKRIAKAVADDGNDESLFLTQPHVKVTFNQAGEVQYCSGWADNSSFSTGGDSLTGQLTLADNRAQGKATLALQGEGALQRSFDFQFDVPLGLDAATATRPKPAGVVKPTVAGKFTGNGKPAKLAFVSARKVEDFNDQPSWEVILTEKDHSKAAKPEIEAVFGRFGSALLISVNEDGGIFGCEVAHQAHDKKPFTSLGKIRTAEFEVGDGYIQGLITTDGEQDVFGEKWEADLKFAAPLAMQKKVVAVEKPRKAKQPAPPADEPEPDTKPAAAAAINVRDLPLPKDVTDIDYKTLVEQMTFKSPAKVQALAKDLTKRLAGQGWTSEGGDLVTAKSAILNRVRGEATLTIMVKPDGTGSTVTVFTTGLDWEEK